MGWFGDLGKMGKIRDFCEVRGEESEARYVETSEVRSAVARLVNSQRRVFYVGLDWLVGWLIGKQCCVFYGLID